ncbi:type II secretion system minor pseudopilin GspI [Enterobacter sichuanensis]|uniref:type II secretion system minor pseudopilin GspI n=1 Tax=Enterobacter TaxID=547 RepID=UPI00064D2A15|nr:MULTISPECIES: type II secretion system minor pseudopilin GspI [Enterobacter]KLW85734.1 type II secretion system protein I [Enterobacter sp. BIDMC92]
MKAQSGMLLLEVLLAMAIFASAVTALVTSMQWQLSALETLKQETLALWVADNQLIKTHTVLSATEQGESSQQGNAFSWVLTGVPSAALNHITVTSSRGKTVKLYAWSPVQEKQEAKHD